MRTKENPLGIDSASEWIRKASMYCIPKEHGQRYALLHDCMGGRIICWDDMLFLSFLLHVFFHSFLRVILHFIVFFLPFFLSFFHSFFLSFFLSSPFFLLSISAGKMRNWDIEILRFYLDIFSIFFLIWLFSFWCLTDMNSTSILILRLMFTFRPVFSFFAI